MVLICFYHRILDVFERKFTLVFIKLELSSWLTIILILFTLTANLSAGFMKMNFSAP